METRTPGSVSGLGKRPGSNFGTAPQADSTVPVRSMVFDEPNLVSHAGLVPAMGLAARAGLIGLTDRHLTVPGGPGHAAGLKVSALVGGIVAGADSIADMAVLKHGGMGKLFAGVRAPTTLGTFLRAVKFGHVRQLDAVAARFLTAPNQQVGLVDPAAVTYVDIDDTIRRTYGYAKQGGGYGYSGVKGLNALLGTVSSVGPSLEGNLQRRQLLNGIFLSLGTTSFGN